MPGGKKKRQGSKRRKRKGNPIRGNGRRAKNGRFY